MTRTRWKTGTTLRLVTAVTAAAAAIGLVSTPALGADEDTTMAETKRSQPHDRDITLAVDNALWDRAAVPAHLVDVSTSEGIVTLKGAVPHLLAKEHAVESAETVRGVRSVIDRIEVDAPSIADDELRLDVVKALAMDPATDSYELDVKVSDGTVTLTGTVDSWAEKELCRKVTAGVRGVRDVQIDIGLLLEIQRPDAEIAADIRQRMKMDVWTDAGPLDVEVTDGAVKLTGSVGSVAEKRRVRSNAWVAGAREVDTGGVKVHWWNREMMERSKAHPDLSDDEIEAAITDAMLYDPRVLSYRPEVIVDDGFVTLTGTVGDLSARRAAEDDARNTHGVWGVRNQLRVRVLQPVEDAVLRREVEQALLRDPYVDRTDVTVTVQDGEVDLFGDVDSTFELRQAERVAERVTGALDIDNHLSVAPITVAVRDDLEIRREIEDELLWSPFVDADEVTVVVSDGVATLTGSVDSWHERRMATQNAKEGGALAVVNQLEVLQSPTGVID